MKDIILLKLLIFMYLNPNTKDHKHNTLKNHLEELLGNVYKVDCNFSLKYVQFNLENCACLD